MKLKWTCLVLLCLAVFSPAPSYGDVKCEDEDESVIVAVTTGYGSGVLDLAVVSGDTITRFAGANGTNVEPEAKKYKFSAKKTAEHDAIVLDIAGKNGKMQFRGKTVVLECSWF